MKKSESCYEPHLILQEVSIPPGGEWKPQGSGWSVMQISEGTGYHLHPLLNRELETGAVLVAAAAARGTIRASQLGAVSICSFNVIPARLTGLITLGEQQFFETATAVREPCLLAPGHDVALRMRQLSGERGRAGLLFRLRLLDIFAELFGHQPAQPAFLEDSSDAKKRLQDFLEQTPSSDLLEMNFNELARQTHCTARHLSRIFHELAGMSFRDKRAELRLARARELLATTNSKIVDVAMESGYKSLSLFNLMFARRFGMSPGKWRKQQARQPDNIKRTTKKLMPPASPTIMNEITFQSAALA
jgi:AraC-like DNA-binding protein